ncbi:ATP synthase subunit gamma [Ilumatobacter coccineus YM16-304]|jgi:F-type H+-transporting ATPase subunit gamma|uniref:ATP synthase gamma chain n=1 Tax=Ilumatobacter coccineus (strain NBRC 103263 / KCTC 29153 / YM16-304) TaxID=1313172 RepID=A0A6C7E852_ILUCY|nr:F0F1 ATP synthase subunit gamma [Ilumatobacter coccineus]BAN01379.1 ATP synthase subunit gamma [Ilumatobacter coccineus YM16-304]
MAGGQERILRGRVKAMQSTKKITRAMELIAGSRIVKAQQRVQAAVPYSEQITEVVKDLAAAGGTSDSPLLKGRDELKTTCYVAITADRGLCGGYNAGIQRATEGEVKADVLKGLDYLIVPVGKKAEGYFRFRNYQLGQSFQGFSDQPSYDDARRIGEYVVDLYASGKVDKVELVYTRFITAGSQEVVLRPLVPLSGDTVAGGDGKAGSDDGTGADFEFEPDPLTILDSLLPRYVEARIYAALLNAAASEHAFRQRAMKSATDNAEELIKSLSIVMNRARQASITAEIMEIVGGAAALEGDVVDGAYLDLGDDGSMFSGINPAATIAPAAPMGDNTSSAASSAPAGVATLEREEAPEPASDAAPAGDVEPDDLKRIKGVASVLEGRLHEMGIFTFKEITTWNDEDMDRIDDHLGFEGRIQRDDWQGQARQFHNEKYPDDQI